jgi:hypothetical protein
MTSPKQLEANRRNAKLSSGPKSTEGKARSSRNALKHGLVSSEIVIWDVEAELQPNSTIERELVDHLAGLLWRRRRIPALEAAFGRCWLAKKKKMTAAQRCTTQTILLEGTIKRPQGPTAAPRTRQ